MHRTAKFAAWLVLLVAAPLAAAALPPAQAPARLAPFDPHNLTTISPASCYSHLEEERR